MLSDNGATLGRYRLRENAMARMEQLRYWQDFDRDGWAHRTRREVSDKRVIRTERHLGVREFREGWLQRASEDAYVLWDRDVSPTFDLHSGYRRDLDWRVDVYWDDRGIRAYFRPSQGMQGAGTVIMDFSCAVWVQAIEAWYYAEAALVVTPVIVNGERWGLYDWVQHVIQ